MSATSDASTTGTASLALPLVERLEVVLEKLGTLHNQKFAQVEKFILENLEDHDPDSSSQFEQAHVKLGELLGFDAGNQETNGAPDPWWIVDENLCFIFEDHSGGKPEANLHLDKARQIATHANWVRNNLPLAESVKIVPVLITPVRFADPDALPHLGEAFIWHLDAFCLWAKNALSVIRELRSVFPGSGDLVWRANVIEAYRKHNMEPEKLIEFLKTQPPLTTRNR